MEINLYEIIGTDTLRHRETANTILNTINQEPENEQVILNFSGITFASRSFLHELLSILNGRDYIVVNANAEIDFMVKVAFTKPKLRLKTSDEIKELVPT